MTIRDKLKLRDRLRTAPMPEMKKRCRSVEEMMAEALDRAIVDIEYYDDFEMFYEQTRAYFRSIAFSFVDSGIPQSAYDYWPDRLRARAKVLWKDLRIGAKSAP